jgi:tRNA-dihydrouridine synthase
MADPRGYAEYHFHLYVVGLLRYCAYSDVLWFHCPNGEARSAKAGARLKAMGTLAGVADICLTIRGHSYYLELKRRTGRQSPEQIAFAAAAGAAGATYAVARSPEEAKEILRRWGALRPDSVADVVKHMLSA